MLFGFCPARFGVLLGSVVLGCWYTPAVHHVINNAHLLTMGLFVCDIVIIDLYHYCVCCIRMGATRCTLLMMLDLDRMAVWITSGALVAHRYTYVPPRCRISQPRRIFIPLPGSLWNDLTDTVFYGVGLAGFKSRPMLFYWPNLLKPYYGPTIFPFFLFLSIGLFPNCLPGIELLKTPFRKEFSIWSLSRHYRRSLRRLAVGDCAGTDYRSLLHSLNIIKHSKHHETVVKHERIVKHHETLEKHHEPLVKHRETLRKHH